MTRLFTRIRCFFAAKLIRFREAEYDFVQFHLGTNSIVLLLSFIVLTFISYKSDVLVWNYLKGFEPSLSFFIGLFAVIFGIAFYRYWRLDEDSIYSLHLAKKRFLPREINVVWAHRDFTFGIGSRLDLRFSEFSVITRRLLAIGIFINLALVTLDNAGYEKLENTPTRILAGNTNFCPVGDEIAVAAPKENCELIIRAFELGYAKDLGTCAPDEISAADMKICEKRRVDEPYLHYFVRVLASAAGDLAAFLTAERFNRVKQKFELQLDHVEELRDYRANAMSASPRAAHHIWTNLRYPDNELLRFYRERLKPNDCLARFQNQANSPELDDELRKDSKMLEHVYGQLLFNPRTRLTVGYCKEYKIHWEAPSDICDRLARDPEPVLREQGVYEDVELVLRRHDIANVIVNLEQEIKALDPAEAEQDVAAENEAARKSGEKSGERKGKIVVSTIAKDKQQIRPKNELVSFQCFMQSDRLETSTSEQTMDWNGTRFSVNTRQFPVIQGEGAAQIAMYEQFAKLLDDRFRYSQFSSRSELDVEGSRAKLNEDVRGLESPDYLLSRLETLQNTDIFLGNNWVLERRDLLDVYPYHVHLRNYVDSFRNTYRDKHGRL